MTLRALIITSLSFVLLIVVPAESDAGLFGFLKRHRSKSNCCPCPAVPPKEVKSTYTCWAFIDDGYDGDGNECWEASDPQSDAVCSVARQRAIDDVMDNGCSPGRVRTHCMPGNNGECPMMLTQEELLAESPTGCFYRVSYVICYWNGTKIDESFCDYDLEFAKFAAKKIACDLAKNSNCRIRNCRWKICRVSSCDGCGQ